MESVGTGRPSASYSCNMYKEKLGSIRKIGVRTDLIGRPAVYSLRTVISFFPTRAVTTTFHCREFSFHPLQQCLCHPSYDLKTQIKERKERYFVNIQRTKKIMKDFRRQHKASNLQESRLTDANFPHYQQDHCRTYVQIATAW